MSTTAHVQVNIAVEGQTDAAVAERLITAVGAIPGRTFGKNGKARLRLLTPGYVNAANHAPWLILVDLDNEHECAVPLIQDWGVADTVSQLCFRVAVRQIEAWLLADLESFATFFRVRRGSIPENPDALPDPKRCVVDLAMHSRRHAIRQDMVPRAGSGRAIGPAYPSRIIEFANNFWNPVAAAKRSDSLSRALVCLRNLVARVADPDAA